jgi:hypothetical protein
MKTKNAPVPRSHVLILGFLVFLSLSVRLGMIWIDPGVLTCGLEVLQDDSVYNYEVARNIVDGKGITFEEGEPIFAYHPPSILFMIPFLWLFPQSKMVPIQCLLTLYSVISLLTVPIIYRIIRRISSDTAALVSAGSWTLGYGIALYAICGADTPVTLFLVAAALDFFLKNIRLEEAPRTRSYAVLGVLCGLCIYSRMDTLLLLPAFGLSIAWTHRGHLFWGGIRKIAAAGAVMALAVAVTTAPFFLRNVLYYKSFEVHNASSNRTLSIVMGHYTRTLGLDRLMQLHREKTPRTPLDPMLTELSGDFRPVWWGLYAFCFAKGLAVLPVKYGDVFLPLLFLAGMILWSAARQEKGGKVRRLRQFMDESGIQPLNAMLLYAVMHFSLYAFYQFSFWHTSRYMYPLAFVATLYLGPAAAWVLERALRPRFSGRVSARGFVLGLFALWMVSFSVQACSLVRATRCEGGNGLIQAANWINEHTPKDAVIGFYQGGYFGYFIDRKFHDLGGKATAKAWNAWLDRKEWDYILEKGVDYIVDEDFYMDFVFAWSGMYPIRDKLELVNQEFGRNPGTRILIFKVKKQG